MKSFKKISAFILILVIFSMSILTAIPTSAAFYTKTITDSSTITHILNLVKQNDGNDLYNKMYYIFYNSQFAAAYNKQFPYPNSGSSHNTVVDNGTSYKLDGYSRGCYLYADYVSRYVYGFGSHSSRCKSVWINSTAGTMTTQDIKNTVMTHAQAGEHIYIAGNVHSVSFVAYDDNGFYYTNYRSDSSPYIYIHYTTWDNFKNECNSKGQRACLLDFNLTPNETSTTVTINSLSSNNTITDTNAIVWGEVLKPTSYAVTKIGIKVRKDGGTYENGWEKYEDPSRNYVGDSYMRPYYNMNTELNLTLTHATKYYYKFYALVNGKAYWSDEYSITTTGSHSYGSWTTVTAASCTTEGSAKRTCSCGKAETKTLSALGHNYSSSYTTDTSASCTAAGSKSKHCTRCSAKTSVTSIPATGHSWSSWSTTKNPTCTDSGEQKRSCSVCKVAETKTLAAKGHSFSDKFTTDKAATCTTSGSKSKHCQNCSAKTSVTSIAPTGHKWSEFETTTEPTTDKEGLSVRHCQNDNCNAAESKVLPRLATDGHTHSFGTGVVVKNATCTEEGETQSKCNLCDEIEKHTLSALGHNFSEWSEPDQNGLSTRKCDTCNTVEERTIEQTVSSEDVSSIQNSSTTASEKVQEDNSGKQSFPYIWIIIACLAFIVGGGLSALIFIKKK